MTSGGRIPLTSGRRSDLRMGGEQPQSVRAPTRSRRTSGTPESPPDPAVVHGYVRILLLALKDKRRLELHACRLEEPLELEDIDPGLNSHEPATGPTIAGH
jgi:hypothetical protein